MIKKHISITQIIRHIVQTAAFLLFPGLFILIFSSLGDIVTACINGTFSLAQLYPQIILTVAVFAVTALMGRFFCGYMCSFGMFQEIIHFFRRKRTASTVEIKDGADRKLKLIKYVLLALIVLTVWIMQMPVGSSLSPWGVFGVLVSGNFDAVPDVILTPGFVLLAGIAVGAFFVEHFFCRYLCPLGAMFTAVSRGRLCNVERQANTCTHCGLCTKACSMGIRDISETGKVVSGECIQCMECITACPQGSLSVDSSGAAAGIAAAAIGAAVVFGDVLAVPSTDGAQYGQQVAEAASVVRGAYQDGTYKGAGRGFRGETEVEVTIDNGYITDITVVSSDDDRQFLQQAQSGVISQIIAKQSPNVSAVSGATYSSRGIMSAVADALGAELSASEYDEGNAGPAATERKMPGQSRKAIFDSVYEPSEAPQQTEEQQKEDTNSYSGGITAADGTYEGEGQGFRGETRVSVTVEGGKITDINVISYDDDRPYFSRAQESVISQIMSAQSLDVQAVSGATYSSRGIIEAVADALGMDFSAPAPGSSGGKGHASGASGYGSSGRGGHGKSFGSF